MEFDKPAFLVDPGICRRNIRMMAEKAARSGVWFRPHFKTHQSIRIGRWFREEGVNRITVSSLSAAEYFMGDGWNDITVAFPLNLRESERVNRLASQIRLGILLEDVRVARELDRRLDHGVDAWLKIDTGYHRTGLDPENESAIMELARSVCQSRHLRLSGLLTHAGQTYQAGSVSSVRDVYAESVRLLKQAAGYVRDLAPGLILSYGDTPSCTVLEEFPGIDEIRPGNFVFYDLMQMTAGVCKASMVGGIVVCPVVAVHPERNQAVIYGGAVHLSKDSVEVEGRRIFGLPVTMHGTDRGDPVEGAWLVSLSQEHGIVEGPPEWISTLGPGGIIGVIPVHSCLTASELKRYVLAGGGEADYFPG